MVIYRAYRTQVIYDLELNTDHPPPPPEKLFRTKISWEPPLCVRAAKKKLRIAQISRDALQNQSGKKTESIEMGYAYYFQFLRKLWF